MTSWRENHAANVGVLFVKTSTCTTECDGLWKRFERISCKCGFGKMSQRINVLSIRLGHPLQSYMATTTGIQKLKWRIAPAFAEKGNLEWLQLTECDSRHHDTCAGLPCIWMWRIVFEQHVFTESSSQCALFCESVGRMCRHAHCDIGKPTEIPSRTQALLGNEKLVVG